MSKKLAPPTYEEQAETTELLETGIKVIDLMCPFAKGGSEYTTGVTTSTAGSTVIEVTANTPTTLYYYCSIHSGMGGTITVSS